MATLRQRSRRTAIVGSAVILTLMATLFASWAWGFTLNRVSLFALIFSIGILVDDAIVEVVCEDDGELLDLLNTEIRAVPGVMSTETLVYLKLVKQQYNWGTR